MHTKVVNMATIGGNQPVNRLEIFIQLYIDRTCMILHRKRLVSALPPYTRSTSLPTTGYVTLSSILSSACSKKNLSLKEKTECCQLPQMSILFCPRSYSYLTRVNPRSLTHLLPSSTRHLRHVLPPPRPFHTSTRRSFKTIEEARSRTRSGVIAPPSPLLLLLLISILLHY